MPGSPHLTAPPPRVEDGSLVVAFAPSPTRHDRPRYYVVRRENVVLIGRDPSAVDVPPIVQALRGGRNLKYLPLPVTVPGPDSCLSALQCAIWVDNGIGYIASLGTNDIHVQPWGASVIGAAPKDGVQKAGPLTTYWLPPSEQRLGLESWRWQLAVIAPGSYRRADRRGPNGTPGEDLLPDPTIDQFEALVYRFRDFLHFPAITWRPAPRECTGEQKRYHRLIDNYRGKLSDVDPLGYAKDERLIGAATAGRAFHLSDVSPRAAANGIVIDLPETLIAQCGAPRVMRTRGPQRSDDDRYGDDLAAR